MRADSDEPYNYNVSFTWRWFPESRAHAAPTLKSVAEFVNANNRWALVSFTDEKHDLVQIGAKFHEGVPPRIPEEWDKLKLKIQRRADTR